MAPRKESFLVNLWLDAGERTDAGPHAWRGSVVHLTSQERRYFTEMVDLVAFLMRCSEHGTGDISKRFS